MKSRSGVDAALCLKQSATQGGKRVTERVSFSDRELDVMSVLWDRGSGTVREVKDEIVDDLAYTTVLTVCQTLEEKGHVRHEQEGRAYRYYPTVEQDVAGRSALRKILDKIFLDSPQSLLAQLISERELSTDELERMHAMLGERLEEARGG